MENYSAESRCVYFNSRDALIKVDLTKVVYFASDGNYTSVVSVQPEAKAIVLANLGKIEKMLSVSSKGGAVFVRIGKRFIVNIKYIFSIIPLKQELVLSDQSTFTCKLEVSKDALKNLKEVMMSSVKTKTK